MTRSFSWRRLFDRRRGRMQNKNKKPSVASVAVPGNCPPRPKRGSWGANERHPVKRTRSTDLDKSEMWKALHDPTEEKAMTLQGLLERALVPWPRGNNQYFLPVDQQDRLITAAKVATEFQRLYPRSTETERQQYVGFICKSARKLFGILLGRAKGESIVSFLKNGITDKDLPFMKFHPNGADKDGARFTLRSKNWPEKRIEAIETWSFRDIHYFYCEQWWFTAPVFDTQGKHHQLDDDTVLPFVEDRGDSVALTNMGGYSDVWGVRIHLAHQKLFRSTDPRFPVPLLAVKRPHSSLEEDFRKEQSMLKSIAEKNHPHIVKLLATYCYRGRYHLLFPWAPCNLRVYWENNHDPSWDRESVLWDIGQMEGLTSGLYEIHNFKLDKPRDSTIIAQPPDTTRLVVPGTVPTISVEASEYQYGRHGDLKPENILWSYELEGVSKKGVLQIADFGLGRFHGRESRSQMPANLAIASPTYEPPEIPLNRKVSRAYDIWSLGCVLLEFVTWCLGGFQLLSKFSEIRNADGGDGTENDKFFTIKNHKTTCEEAIVRGEVLDWIEQLLRHPRCSEAMLELLEIVKQNMLVIDPRSRISSKDLKERLRAVRKRAEEDELFLLGSVERTQPPTEGTYNFIGPKPFLDAQQPLHLSIPNGEFEKPDHPQTPTFLVHKPSNEELR